MISRPVVLWFLLVLAAGLVLFKQSQELQLNSDIRAMLPESLADDLGLAAREQLSAKLEGLNFIAVGHAQKSLAVAGAERLANDLRHSQAFEQVLLKRQGQGEAIARALYPYRYVRLTQQQRQWLAADDYQALFARAQAQLWSPAGMVSSSGLVDDPLFLFIEQLDSLSKLASSQVDEQGYLNAYAEGKYWILLELHTKENVFAPQQQQGLILAINDAEQALKAEQGSLSLLKAGLLFHAQAATAQAKSEMTTIGLTSLVLVVVLILFFFASVRPLLLALVSLSTGMLLALAAVSLCFSQLHLLTLVFGASLIGIAIDYSFHFCAEHAGGKLSAKQSLHKIKPALLLGALSSVLAYLSMLLVPMQGIRQMALFCAVGLFGAALSLYCLAPLLAASIPPARWPKRWPQWSLNKYSMGFLLLFIVGGLLQLHSEDDIRQLRGEFPSIEQQQQRLLDMFQNGQANQFFLVRGDSEQQLLSRERQLLAQLEQVAEQGALDRAWGLSDLAPPKSEQASNYGLLKSLYQQRPLLAEQLAYTPALLEQANAKFVASEGDYLALQDLLAQPAFSVFKDFWLHQGAQQASIVSLFSIHDLAALQQVAQQLDGVEFVDPVGEISLALSTLRQQALQLLVGVVLVIAAILSLRLGWKTALRCLFTPVMALLLSLALVAWLGQGLSLFHVLALLLVFGVGLDYALFYQLSRQPSYRLVMATSLAACSTLLAFGLLALSATPALAGFGVVVLGGIASSYFLAPQAFLMRGQNND
ncbi:MMPL family transporter [Agarivorans gilvus]|uniref:MMPL family efflux pump permease component n=1 Tax=Agarivorans gilvus TaxID=680279 RepID=A0ABQ1I396_9ALTE|nr:MMPL family transporter [Agarivorans gilvus]GGB07923.1 MMPL family efflux pump permease component [Agarivorans gilvus]